MYHIVKMSGKLYGADVSELDADDLMERLEGFANEGTPALIVGELDDVADFGIDVEDITIVILD